MPAAGERVSQGGDLWGRDMHDRTVDPTSQPLADFLGVATITFLRRPISLQPNLVGIDHHRLETEAEQKTCRVERHRPGFQTNPRAGR